MVFIIAINLALVLVAIIASIFYGDLAQKKGYLASKARKYVVLVSFLALFLMMVGQTLVSYISNLIGSQDGGIPDAMIYGWSAFVFLVCIAVLYKAYKNMKLAPDANTQKKTKAKKAQNE